MTLLFGIGWLLLLLGTWIACSYFPARWLARRLGLSPFRLFDSELRGTWARRVAVRCLSVVAPLV